MKIEEFEVGNVYYASEVEQLGKDWVKQLNEKFIWKRDEDNDIEIIAAKTKAKVKRKIKNIDKTLFEDRSIKEIYFKTDDEQKPIDYGFYCMSRINYDKLDAILKDQKNELLLFKCVIAIARNMTPNNYIKRCNYEDLAEMINFTRDARSLMNASVLLRLEELNIITVDNDKRLMLNPKIAFATTCDQKTLEKLHKCYTDFRDTGKFEAVCKGNAGN